MSAAERQGEALDAGRWLAIHRTMLVTRAFDEYCMSMLERGEEVPHFHSGVGQEALAVAAVAPLRVEDQIVYTHRGIGQLLAKGISLREIVADLFMVEGGTNGGMGSILHVSRPDIGVPGREGVFGTRFGISVGLALAARLRGRDEVVVCFYGEAAGARGALYESMNMAVLWSLPIVFVGENNGWSFTSRTEWLYPEGRMSRVWRGYDIPVREIDGNDVREVFEATSDAVERARAGRGPTVLEGITYRMHPHIWYDPASYQPQEELEHWAKRDPLARSRELLLGLGVPAPTLDAAESAARQEVEAAFAAAREADAPAWAAPVVGVTA